VLHALAEPAGGLEGISDPQLSTVAHAYGLLPVDWQTVLWYRFVDGRPAVEVAVPLGRSADDVLALEQTAIRGLFDLMMQVELRHGPSVRAMCRPIVTSLGAYRRGTLPLGQARLVERHLGGEEQRTAGCADCRTRLASADRVRSLLAPALLPWVVGQTAAAYAAAVRVSPPVGASAREVRRAAAERKRARVLAVAAVAVAVVAAVVLIRAPLRLIEPGLARLFDGVVGPERSVAVDDAPASSLPPSGEEEASEIELVFPASPRGVVYVPGGRALSLDVALSTPAPFFSGATGTLDVAMTNTDSEPADVTFYVRTSDGITFLELTEGEATCRAEDDDGGTCSLSIPSGQRVSMSLRFALAAELPDRLLVDPGVDAPSLDLPIVDVPHLVIGTVERGSVEVVSGTTSECTTAAGCADAEWFDVSGDAVDRALLVWWSQTDATAVPPAVVIDDAGGSWIVEADPGSGGDDGRRGVADVTRLIGSGSGRFTVGGGASGGTWTLVVVHRDASQPRRLLVTIAPPSPVTPAAALAVDVPLRGTQPVVETQSGEFGVVADAAAPVPRAELVVDGRTLGAPDPFGLATAPSAAGQVGSYDLQIAPTTAVLPIAASTPAQPFRVSALTVVVDLAP